MKTISKNIVLISLLILVNLSIYLFCKLLTDEGNFIMNKISPENKVLVSTASLDLMRTHYFMYANSINFFLLGIYFAYYYRKTMGFTIIVLSVLIFWGSKKLFEKNIEEDYYMLFKYQSVPDDFILQPVKSAGVGIGKLILQDVNNITSPHRKYAIIGLGEIKYSPSADTLNTILHNLHEKPDIRGEAFLALQKLDTDKARSYTRIFAGSIHPSTDQEVMSYLESKK